MTKKHHALVLTLHHIICDEHSISIFCQELSNFYNLFLSKKVPQLEELTFQFKDFALKQESRRLSADLNHQLKFWKRKLSRITEHVQLPYANLKNRTQDKSGELYETDFLIPGLLNQVRQNDVSFFQYLLAIFNIFLFLSNKTNPFAIGIPVSTRGDANTRHILGYFVNVLALPVTIISDEKFFDLVQRIKREIIEATDHQDVSFSDIVRHLKINNSSPSNPIFQVMFTQKQNNNAELNFINTISQTRMNLFHSQFDVGFSVFDLSEDQVGVSVEYDKNLFENSAIKSFVKKYQTVLAATVNLSEPTIRDIELSLSPSIRGIQ